MALPTVHVISGFAGGDGPKSYDKQPIFKGPHLWSEEVAANTKSTNAALDRDNMRPVVRVTVQADVWFAYGLTPDPTASPRFLLQVKDGPQDLYLHPGDFHKWILAV